MNPSHGLALAAAGLDFGEVASALPARPALRV